MQLRLAPINTAARPASLGGAFIGIADDATAAAINPAGLSFLQRPEVSLSQAMGWHTREFPVGEIVATDGQQSQAQLVFDQTLVTIVYPQWGFTFALFRRANFRSQSDFARQQFLTIEPARRLTLHEQLGASGNFPGISSQFSSEVIQNAVVISKAWRQRHRLGLSLGSTQLKLQLHERHYFDPEFWRHTNFSSSSDRTSSNHIRGLYQLYELQRDVLKPSWSLGLLTELHPHLTLGLVYQNLPSYNMEAHIILPAYSLPDTIAGDGRDDEIRFAADEDSVRFVLNLADHVGVGLAWKPNPRTLLAADAVFYFNRSVLQGVTMNLPQDDRLQKDGSYADPDGQADLAAHNVLTLHAGLEYTIIEQKVVLPVRLGFYTEPNFGLRASGNDKNLQSEYPDAAMYLHVTGGMGVRFKHVRFDGSIDVSESLLEAIGSVVVRF